jgi:hypothetical protein
MTFRAWYPTAPWPNSPTIISSTSAIEADPGNIAGIEIKCAPKYAETRLPMTATKLTIADIILIAGTRVVLGAGIGLLISTRLNNDQRKAAGLSLALVGGLTTIPLALGVIGKHRGSQAEFRQAA